MILEGTHHTDPITFGEELRRLRDRAGVSLDDICTETKISRRILEALEDGQFGFLPERVFSRSFVRQVAEAIGDDGSQLLEDFDIAWTRFEQDSGSFRVNFVEDSAPARSIRWGFWFPISVGFVILMSAAVVILSGSDPGEESLVETPHRAVSRERPPVTPTPACSSGASNPRRISCSSSRWCLTPAKSTFFLCATGITVAGRRRFVGFAARTTDFAGPLASPCSLRSAS